ncbi:DsbA family protein [Castellaniella hirudinis]|uniref:DsbA family protein n=1 Tax=Castellaniella hirudinis TaxID=1144617 RepID=A0ABV8RZ45_9BURK
MILHHIFDPLCGWCYAVTPLVQAAHRTRGVHLVLHAGGMLSGPLRRRINADWRSHVMGHDRRIAALSGQPFGDAYFNGLLRDETAWMDSMPPTAAILAAEEIAGQGVNMLARIQRGHYLEGQHVADPDVLGRFARDLELADDAFAMSFESWAGVRGQAHVDETRRLMERFGVTGFPTLLTQDGDAWNQIPIQRYLGRPAMWREVLESVAV